MSKLDFLTVCGADDQVDTSSLVSMCKSSVVPLNVGLLFDRSKMGQSWYPSAEWIEALAVRLESHSAHKFISVQLCEPASIKQLLTGRDLGLDLTWILKVLGKYISSIQLNLIGVESWYRMHNRYVLPLYVSQLIDRIRVTGKLSADFKLILQCKELNDDITDMVQMLDIAFPLIDVSGGKDRLRLTELDVKRIRQKKLQMPVGLAGGISLDNVHSVLDLARDLPSEEFWLSSTSGCMNAEGLFSINRVKAMVETIDLFDVHYGVPTTCPIQELESESLQLESSFVDCLEGLVLDTLDSISTFPDYWVRYGTFVTTTFVKRTDCFNAYRPKDLCKYARDVYDRLRKKKA